MLSIGNLTEGGGSHIDVIEVYGSDNITFQRCRTMGDQAGAVWYTTVLGNITGPDTPNQNPVIFKNNYTNSEASSPFLVEYESGGIGSQSGTKRQNVQYIGNWWGDQSFWGRILDLHGAVDNPPGTMMNLSYFQSWWNANQAANIPGIVLWTMDNVWAPNGEGVLNNANAPSGDAQAGLPHTPGAFITDANVTAGVRGFAWTGQLLGNAAAAFSAISLTASSPVLAAPTSGQPGVDPYSAVDGSLNAPSGTAQYPTILNTYHAAGHADARVYGTNSSNFAPANANYHQPPWFVAGVDYAVGVQPGTTLQDPTAGGLPAGCSLSGSVGAGRGPTLTVSNASTVLNGWDFTKEGGICLIIGANNCTITNCKFAFQNALPNVGSPSDGLIKVNPGTSGFTFKYNEVNGSAAWQKLQGCSTLDCAATGACVFQYNYIHDTPSIGYIQAAAQNLDYRFNLFVNIAQYPGEHLNCLENAFSGGTYTINLSFNTIIQYPTGMPGGEAWQVYNNNSGSTIGNSTVSNNTVVTPPVNPGAQVRSNSTAYNEGAIIVAPAGAAFPYYKVYIGGTTASSVPSKYASATTPDAVTISGSCASGVLTINGINGPNNPIYVGMGIFGGTPIVTPGTQISSFISGTGSSGTYGVTGSQNFDASDSPIYGMQIMDGSVGLVGDKVALSVALHGSGAYGGATTTFAGPATVNFNYIDDSDLTSGNGFYAGSLVAVGWTATGNISMVTGTAITPT